MRFLAKDANLPQPTNIDPEPDSRGNTVASQVQQSLFDQTIEQIDTSEPTETTNSGFLDQLAEQQEQENLVDIESMTAPTFNQGGSVEKSESVEDNIDNGEIIPVNDPTSVSTDITIAAPSNSNDLINEVDQLIDSKLFTEPDTTRDLPPPVTNEPFTLDPDWRVRLRSAIVTGFVLFLCVLFSLALAYQLWLKQALPWPDEQHIEKITTILEPIKIVLDERYQILLPERRDLRKLRLLSAKTEAHPTRSSMILLRVSFLNRSAIEQPLPWVELTLTDEEGRLVSRRALRPDDYLYNNQTDNRIDANQLKKIAIELLAFPKQAHGYELRLLNK